MKNGARSPEPSGLSLEQIEALREEIGGELAGLVRRMEASGNTVRPVELDPGSVGRLSRMDELQNQAMAKGLRERERQRLDALHQALERIEVGTYGTCVDCGGAIPFARLEAYPEISTCMACSR